jgi:hypothetical protein
MHITTRIAGFSIEGNLKKVFGYIIEVNLPDKNKTKIPGSYV